MGEPGATMPVTDIIRRPCGVRYHEAVDGGTTPLCACSTFAIGICADCAKPVCGDCSRVFGGRRLCSEHADAREDAAVQAAIEARLTPQKFLALAAAVGNPGLRSWTVAKTEKVLRERKVGWRRTDKYYELVTVEKYELRGWVFPEDSSSEDMMISDEGVTYRWDNGVETSRLADINFLYEGHLRPTEDGRGHGFSDEYKDLRLRQLCKSLNIPI